MGIVEGLLEWDPALPGLMRQSPRRGHRFVQKTYSLGPEQHFRWDKALADAEAIEDEELSRRLTLRR